MSEIQEFSGELVTTETRVEKVKGHFRRNKKVYIVGAVTFVVGAATAVLATRKNADINNSINQILSYKPEATLEVTIEALGHPGNIIQDTTTGSIYASQNQAAKELGVNSAIVSRHLNGDYPNVKGHQLVNLGPAVRTK